MNTIKQLIDKYCPDGVEYKKLGEVCTVKGRIGFRGYTRADLVNKGEGAISLSPSNIINGRINYSKCSYISWKKYYESPEIMIENGDVIFCKTASVGKTCIINELPDKATINPQLVVFKDIKINHKYLSYYVSGSDFQKRIIKIRGLGSIPTLSQKDLAEQIIPVPPLSVQREIVRILDSFTSLEAELEAELEARRKQYEYYRDQLLSFKHLSGGGKNEVEWKTLGEMGTFIRGNGLQKKDFTDNGFPCIHYGQIHTTYNTFTDKTVSYTSFEKAKHLKKAHKGDLLIATTSEDVDACCKAVAWLGESQCAISGDSYIYHHNQDPKYIAYLFQTDMFAKQKKTAATGTKVIRVSGDAMAKFKFPIPPLSTQRRIVSILDRFESLVNDISTGLPAEIAARHQQYEYYRDQLLSFKRKS